MKNLSGLAILAAVAAVLSGCKTIHIPPIVWPTTTTTTTTVPGTTTTTLAPVPVGPHPIRLQAGAPCQPNASDVGGEVHTSPGLSDVRFLEINADTFIQAGSAFHSQANADGTVTVWADDFTRGDVVYKWLWFRINSSSSPNVLAPVFTLGNGQKGTFRTYWQACRAL